MIFRMQFLLGITPTIQHWLVLDHIWLFNSLYSCASNNYLHV